MDDHLAMLANVRFRPGSHWLMNASYLQSGDSLHAPGRQARSRPGSAAAAPPFSRSAQAKCKAIGMSGVGREGHVAPLSDPEDRATSGSAAGRSSPWPPWPARSTPVFTLPAEDSRIRDDFRGRRASYLLDAVSRNVRWDKLGTPYGDHQSG